MEILTYYLILNNLIDNFIALNIYILILNT